MKDPTFWPESVISEVLRGVGPDFECWSTSALIVAALRGHGYQFVQGVPTGLASLPYAMWPARQLAHLQERIDAGHQVLADLRRDVTAACPGLAYWAFTKQIEEAMTLALNEGRTQ